MASSFDLCAYYQTFRLIREEEQELSEVEEKYHIAHSIGRDFLIEGNARLQKLDEKFALQNKLLQSGFHGKKRKYGCINTGRVFSLVIKPVYWNTPNYKRLNQTLRELKEQCKVLNVKYLAMNKIGCGGRDKLAWKNVRPRIETIFGDTDIEILVCLHKQNGQGKEPAQGNDAAGIGRPAAKEGL